MARSSKVTAQGAPAVSPKKLFEIILEDAQKASAMSFDDWSALTSFPLVSLAIPISSEREIRVTQKGVDAAHTLTAQNWLEREDLRQTIVRAEFDRLSFRAIGEAISDCQRHLPSEDMAEEQEEAAEAFFAAVAADYEANLQRLADVSRVDVYRHIPCHLFHGNQSVRPFSVGPVEFLPRADWIKRYVRDEAQCCHIQRVENREISYDDLREQALIPNSDRSLWAAWELLRSLRNFEWVATVKMEGHELTQSHKKAGIIVGLAIDAIGLRFSANDAKRFTKAGRQHLYAEDRLATSVDGAFLRGSSVEMPGLGAAPGVLATRMEAERPFLDAAGKVLQSYLHGRQAGRALHLVERWANALYWVGEARREASDFMAVVNYGCAADGLSGAGGVANDMTEFAEAALNPTDEPTPLGSLSVSEAVNKVYREGRNKLAHGESSGLFEDLSETRAVGDSLLTHLFDAVTFELVAMMEERPELPTLQERHAYKALTARLKQRRLMPIET